MNDEIIIALISLLGVLFTGGITYAVNKAKKATTAAKDAQDSMPILKGFESVIETLEAENKRMKVVIEKLESVIRALRIRNTELEDQLVECKRALLEGQIEIDKKKKEMDKLIAQLQKKRGEK